MDFCDVTWQASVLTTSAPRNSYMACLFNASLTRDSVRFPRSLPRSVTSPGRRVKRWPVNCDIARLTDAAPENHHDYTVASELSPFFVCFPFLFYTYLSPKITTIVSALFSLPFANNKNFVRTFTFFPFFAFLLCIHSPKLYDPWLYGDAWPFVGATAAIAYLATTSVQHETANISASYRPSNVPLPRASSWNAPWSHDRRPHTRYSCEVWCSRD